MRMREKHRDFFICFKILVVKRLQIDHGSILALVQNRDPAGDAAVTAVDDRKILSGLLFVQIVRNFISDVFRIDLGNDAPQFPDPKLHLYIQEWTQFPGLTGARMRNQCKERVERGRSIG